MIVIRALAVLSGALLLAGFTGRWHPLGDSLSVFRPLFAIGLVLFGLALPGPGRWGAVLLGVGVLLGVLWSLRAPAAIATPELTVYQKNLRFDLADPSELIGDILSSEADIVFLQELSLGNRVLSEALKEAYPTQVICPAHPVGAVAVLSRWPLAEDRCVEARGMVAARLDTGAGPVTAVSMHLHWPYPFRQPEQMRGLVPHLEALEGPVVLSGDFNMVPWAYVPRQIAALTGTRRAGPVRWSLALKRLYLMPIDHVLVPLGWQARAQMRPGLGSDHRGMVVKIARP